MSKFGADLSLGLDAMAKHLEFQLRVGVQGIMILGSARVGSPGLTLSETDAQYVRKIVEEALEDRLQI